MSKKGIILSTPFQKNILGKGVTINNTPEKLELSKYLLYWDEIDYPTNNIVHFGLPEEDFLIEAGVLRRTQVGFNSFSTDHFGMHMIASQEAAFRNNNANEPGCWTIAQLSDSPAYTQATQAMGVELELHDMLPVPAADVPFNDILEFKHQRQDELAALRVYLDELNEGIISSMDIPRAKNAQIGKLGLALKDIDRTLAESGVRRTVGNLRHIINRDFAGAVFAGAGTVGLSTTIGMPPLVAGLAGAGLYVGIKSLQLPGAQCPSELSYISSIKRELR